jgi:hypothetical protein
MWEKKDSLDGTPNAADLHDVDNCYPVDGGSCELDPSSGCAVDADCTAGGRCIVADCQATDGMTIFEWVATLNATNFAGHNDWRVPDFKELMSLLDLAEAIPAIDPAFFSAACNTGTTCSDITDPTCSCNAGGSISTSFRYWSSSTSGTGPLEVDFQFGQMLGTNAAQLNHVRAVRGG